MKKISLIIALVLFSMSLFANSGVTEKKYVIDENGDQLIMQRIAGYPPAVLPEPNKDLPSKDAKLPGNIFWLDNVPAYNWSYGCTATATAMASGYYDNTGVANAYTGGITSQNGGLAPMTNVAWNSQSSQSSTDMNPIAGTKNGVDGRNKAGHGDDFWTDYGDEDTDPYGGAAYHQMDEAGYNICTADYMGTNQWTLWGNSDGSTTIWNYTRGARMYDHADDLASTPPSRDGTHGLRLYWEAKGYTVETNYNQMIDGYNDPADNPDEGPITGGFTFANYMDQIDRGNIVIIGLDGHSTTGYGYDNTGSNQTVYLMDTWDNNNTPGAHTMAWGTAYSNLDHQSVQIVEIGTECGWFAPRNLFALNDNRTVTITWDDPSKGTVANIEYEIYKDGSSTALATGLTTESYVDTDFDGGGADDGMHYYRLKSVYPSVPYTTIISGEEAAVFVSPSVTEFHDNFEGGSGQWILNDGWGIEGVGYNSSNSLSESPSGNYVDNTDQLTNGGSVGEIAPGLNFSAAPDANLDFYFKYDIEESFDYMHLQSCKDGLTWVSLKVWSAEGVGWHQENINIGLFAGEANVRFRFLFISDPGYNVNGSNIDDFNIVPATEDLAPPYVYYSKDKSYYDNNANGFEVRTDITDFTGINYAHVLYKVNGGSESSVNYTSINGDEYYFVIPEQIPGDYVEFRFDCQDTAPTNNQGYTGPFFYQAGLHQKYDNTIVDFFTEIVNSASAEQDCEVICTKFSSFHDDLVGVVIRGYDDASQTEDNSDFIVHVYADDNGGLPGTDLITPFSVSNPATLSDTNAWDYIDLSSYSALQDMTGDYFIGLACDNNVTGNITRSVTTDAGGNPTSYDFGRAYKKWIPVGASAPAAWFKDDGTNYHMRAVTTNYEITPPTIVPSPSVLSETLATDATSSEVLAIGNSGGFDLNYNATIEYVSIPAKNKATVTVESNDFESGLVYTNSGAISFGTASGLTVTCAKLNAKSTGNGTSSGILTSGSFDGTVCTALNLDFDQDVSIGSGSVLVEYYDGSAWNPIYSSTASTTAHQTIALSTLASNMQLRFTGSLVNKSGDSWSIDNVVVSGPEVVLATWLTLDGSTTTSGTVVSASSDNMTIGYDATGLTTEGDYTAWIHLTGTDADPVDVYVTMTVDNSSGPIIPDVPVNVVTSIVGANLVIDWDVSADATGYDVYSSDDPYGAFTFVVGVGTEQYTVAADQAKLFYYIVATNATKVAPKVTIKRSSVK